MPQLLKNLQPDKVRVLRFNELTEGWSADGKRLLTFMCRLLSQLVGHYTSTWSGPNDSWWISWT